MSEQAFGFGLAEASYRIAFFVKVDYFRVALVLNRTRVLAEQ